MITMTRITVLASALSLVACVSVPTGPSVLAMPGSGKNFDQFRADDADCRQYANSSIGTSASQASVDSGVKSAAIGAGVGALAGAAMGGNSQAAGAGAGIGLLFGALAGSSAAYASAGGTQRYYDNAYVQCMYAKGHQVPVAGGMAPSRYRGGPPQSGYYPPPAGAGPAPSGNYPPPPGYTAPPPGYNAPPPPPPPAR